MKKFITSLFDNPIVFIISYIVVGWIYIFIWTSTKYWDPSYDLLGQPVKNLVNGSKDPGIYSVNWDAKDNNGYQVSAGMYLFQLRSGTYVQTRKMILLK